MRRRRRLRSYGAASLELVLVVPVFLGLADLAVLGGRLTESQSRVDSAAHAAARAASLERSLIRATATAQRVTTDALGQGSATCPTPRVAVDTTGFRSGGSVTVTVLCDVGLGDLAWIPLPMIRTITGSAVAPVDTFRGTTP